MPCSVDSYTLDKLRAYARIGVIGPPKAGKTTLSATLGDALDLPIIHSDDWQHLPWSDQSAALAAHCASPDRYLVEGVAVARALRKGLQVDCLIYLQTPLIPLTPGQASLGKGLATIVKGLQGDYPIFEVKV